MTAHRCKDCGHDKAEHTRWTKAEACLVSHCPCLVFVPREDSSDRQASESVGAEEAIAERDKLRAALEKCDRLARGREFGKPISEVAQAALKMEANDE